MLYFEYPKKCKVRFCSKKCKKIYIFVTNSENSEYLVKIHQGSLMAKQRLHTAHYAGSSPAPDTIWDNSKDGLCSGLKIRRCWLDTNLSHQYARLSVMATRRIVTPEFQVQILSRGPK